MNRIAAIAVVCAAQSLMTDSAKAEESTRFQPSVTLQTMVTSTFQLTLGGTFGAGPAWQNRAIVDLRHVVFKNDAIVMTGWLTRDTPSARRDWTAGIGYRLPALKKGDHLLSATVGWQRWLFPSVLGGTNDHLAALNLSYRTKWKLPITVTADDWVLVKSPLRKGNLLHVQANVAHSLWEGKSVRLVLRHGPSTTYSWNFYDRPGWRVIRYGGSVTMEGRKWSLEFAARQQGAIAPRLPDNRYYCLMLTRAIL
jgi:hypothetical protein